MLRHFEIFPLINWWTPWWEAFWKSFDIESSLHSFWQEDVINFFRVSITVEVCVTLFTEFCNDRIYKNSEKSWWSSPWWIFMHQNYFSCYVEKKFCRNHYIQWLLKHFLGIYAVSFWSKYTKYYTLYFEYSLDVLLSGFCASFNWTHFHGMKLTSWRGFFPFTTRF